jgi:tetratricopeptide (TPR) repeat protein
MKHITKYNLSYLVVVLVLFGLSLLTGSYYKTTAIPILGLVAIFLVPGAIQGFFWHEFFLGRRLIRRGQLQEAMEHFQKFLNQVKTHPWLKKMIHLRWAAYTGDVEAMAWSNLGVIHINLGNVDAAESAFQMASETDPSYPIPYFNLSLIALIKDRDSEARQLWQKAYDFGYRKGDFEQMIKLAYNVKNNLKKKSSG